MTSEESARKPICEEADRETKAGLTSPMHFLAAKLAQKLRDPEDGNAVILMQSEKVLVAGNDIF